MSGDSYLGFFLLALMTIVVYMIGHKDGRKRGDAEVHGKQAHAMKALEAANQAVDVATASQKARIESVPPFDAPVAIGARFTYLGIEMVCTSHIILSSSFGHVVPGVKAEYVDCDGRVLGAVFPAHEMEALRAEMARSAPTTGVTA